MAGVTDVIGDVLFVFSLVVLLVLFRQLIDWLENLVGCLVGAGEFGSLIDCWRMTC